MNKKVIQMVRYLQRDGAWVRGERLSAQFGVSTRQIRNYVSAANTSGCLISSSEKGYRLLDMNPSFRMLLDAEDNPESRLKRLLLVLLFSSEPDDIFTFSEQFYVSVPTMEADLQKLRRVLREYALEIVRERDLVWISGAEKNKRRLLCNYCYAEQRNEYLANRTSFFPQDAAKEISLRQAVREKLLEQGIFANDYSLGNIALYLAVSAERICAGFQVEASGQLMPDAFNRIDLAVTALAAYMSLHFSLSLSEAETQALREVLIQQVSLLDYTKISPDNLNEFVEEKYGAIVVATGFNPISMEKFDEYAYSQSKDVITSLELERLMNAAGPTGGTLLRPSDGAHPHTIVFVQCVGSRCAACAEKGKEYCSKICCMYTAKHAMLIRDKYPDTEVYVFYIDVRTPGKNFDEFYRRAVEEYGVHYIKGMVGKVSPEGNKLKVQGSDLIYGKQLHIDADLVVLAAAIEPDKSARPLATMLTASMDTNDFFTEAHPKLRPVESPTAGVFLSGACQGPKDIPETVSQAGAAASKVIGLLCKDKLTGNPCVAHSDEMMCNGCSTCEKVCPYGAITYVDKEFRMPDRTTKVRRVAVVNEAVCQGCGACTVACMSGAMDLRGFLNKQIMAEVDAICK